jgi:hypothetical protein
MTQQEYERFHSEQLDSIIRGCKGILSTSVRFRRGGLGDLSQALSQHVSLSFVPSVDFLRKQSEALRTEGIELIFHDDAGRDVELMPVEMDKS